MEGFGHDKVGQVEVAGTGFLGFHDLVAAPLKEGAGGEADFGGDFWDAVPAGVVLHGGEEGCGDAFAMVVFVHEEGVEVAVVAEGGVAGEVSRAVHCHEEMEGGEERVPAGDVVAAGCPVGNFLRGVVAEVHGEYGIAEKVADGGEVFRHGGTENARGGRGEGLAEIEHVAQEDAVLDDGVVVVCGEEIGDGMRVGETVLAIKGGGLRGVAGADKQGAATFAVVPAEIAEEAAADALALGFGLDGKVLQFAYALAFEGDDGNGDGGAVVIAHDVQVAALQVTVYHAFLLVRQQEEGEEAFFVVGDEFDGHRRAFIFCQAGVSKRQQRRRVASISGRRLAGMTKLSSSGWT